MASSSSALVDRLVGLPVETIESFSRVAPNLNNEIAPTAEEDEVRVVLRSCGEPLASTFQDSNSHRRPPFAVCLAHHSPTDTFTLFAFSPAAVPCRLVRFDRDGKEVTRWDKAKRNKHSASTTTLVAPYLWSSSDAKVLVAAVERCKEYFIFDTSATVEDGKSDASAAERAECIRLVSQKQGKSNDDIDEYDNDDGSSRSSSEPETENAEEAVAVRTIILNQLLQPSAGGSSTSADDSFFQHPDPNFMIPLAKSILSELKYWRELCRGIPPSAVWPDLPPESSSEEELNDKEIEEDRLCGKVGTEDRELFDLIMSKRMEQVKRSGDLCRKTSEKMRSLLLEVGGTEHNAVFELGEGCVVSLVRLEQLQQLHWETEDWCECNEALADMIEEQKQSYQMTAGRMNDILVDWFAGGDGHRSTKTVEKEKEETMDEPDDIDSAARAIIDGWKKDDADLLEALSSAILVVKEAIKSGDQAKLKGAADELLSMETGLKISEENAYKMSIRNVAKLVKFWNTRSEDEGDDDNVWRESRSQPDWTGDQEEAHLSFGWRANVGEIRVPPIFVVDQTGLSGYLENCISDLSLDKESRKYVKDDKVKYLDKGHHFDRWWKSNVTSIIDNALAAIEIFVQAGDLHNAAHLLVACCRNLCDGRTAGRLRHKLVDSDGSFGSEKIVTSKLREEIGRFDPCAVRVAFKYIDQHKSEASFFRAGAHWFYDVLKSGAIFFPGENDYMAWGEIERRSYSEPEPEPTWYSYEHPAVAVFEHHGWKHPILRRALSGDTVEIKHWRRRESPLVIKERFVATKEQGETNKAIALAKMMGGDHEALHFLVSNGLANDAIGQASCSGNEKGLGRLASDLIDMDPRASFLCAQAHILGATEKSRRNDTSNVLPHASIDILVDLFIKRYIASLVDTSSKTVSALDDMALSVAPSLRHLSIMAATRKFLFAAESTVLMQGILETTYVEDAGIRLVLCVAALAVICRTASDFGYQPSDGPRYVLNKAELLSGNKKDGSSGYSGVLTAFDPSSESVSVDHSDLSCAIFECSKYTAQAERLKRSPGDIDIDFGTGLFSAVYVAVQSGCHTFALHAMHSIKSKCDENVYAHHRESPFTCLAACFSRLFCSKYRPQHTHPDLRKELLKTFFSLRTSSDVPQVVSREQTWATLAYAMYDGYEDAASLLAECVYFNQSSSDSELLATYHPLRIMKYLAVVDTEQGVTLAEMNAMSTFASSSCRVRVDRSERELLCSAYLRRLWTLSVSSGTQMKPCLVAKCVRIDSLVNPLFWRLEADQVEGRVSQATGLASCFSEKQFLHYVCRIMYFIDFARGRDEMLSTRCFSFACGLSWLRAVLLPTELPAFDHTRGELSGRMFTRFKKDNSTLIGRYDWEEPPYYSSEGHFLDNSPMFTAYAIVVNLEKHALAINDSAPGISHLCNEALALCKVMHFLLRPSPTSFEGIVGVTEATPSEGSFQLPLHLQPESLLDSILRCRWGTSCEFSSKENEDRSWCAHPTAPHLVPRVCLALSHGKIKEAAALCVAEGKSEELWNKLSQRSWGMDRETKIARDLMQGCLLTLRAAATASTELSKEFINISTHIILTMNWFRYCSKCSPVSDALAPYSQELVPSTGNVEALHETASAWVHAIESNDTVIAAHVRPCARMICCLDRCYSVFDQVWGLILETKERHLCGECFIKPEEHDCYSDGEKAVAQPSIREKRLKQRNKRKRENEYDIDADFKELQSFITQVHLKEASDWCNHMLPKIKAAVSNQDRSERTHKEVKIS